MKSIRIETIADMIHPGMITADIGTDHAFLPVLLTERKISPKVYACDAAEKPLSGALKNIRAAGLEDSIQTILSDGFEHVPSDTEAAVIAGMGYHTAAQILDRAIDRLPLLKQIIVEVNRNPNQMRQWISDHHFTICDEQAVYEKGHDYIIISFDCHTHEPYSEEEILCGTSHLRSHGTAYEIYAGHRLEKIEQILSVSDGNAPAVEQYRKEKEIFSKYIKG